MVFTVHLTQTQLKMCSFIKVVLNHALVAGCRVLLKLQGKTEIKIYLILEVKLVYLVLTHMQNYLLEKSLLQSLHIGDHTKGFYTMKYLIVLMKNWKHKLHKPVQAGSHLKKQLLVHTFTI